jgi:hypothetical protein
MLSVESRLRIDRLARSDARRQLYDRITARLSNNLGEFRSGQFEDRGLRLIHRRELRGISDEDPLQVPRSLDVKPLLTADHRGLVHDHHGVSRHLMVIFSLQRISARTIRTKPQPKKRVNRLHPIRRRPHALRENARRLVSGCAEIDLQVLLHQVIDDVPHEVGLSRPRISAKTRVALPRPMRDEISFFAAFWSRVSFMLILSELTHKRPYVSGITWGNTEIEIIV